ncbi:hypothetical protein [Bradyrhizobium sp.]|uniref:hypothetical protein n=1 Tax=Bradyrhizobium sp. TaxID=376 RepID=UPI002725FE0B|nr:hypothetical protein [Bradyrhizobium sp.]MDO9298663.1 hypothetical protein [Bradyrhizobium sp.]
MTIAPQQKGSAEKMGVERPSRISFPDLMETARTFPDEIRADANRQTFTLAASIIRHFLGQPWYQDHIVQDAENSYPPGFLRLDFSSDFERERKTARFLDFAEMLFNLQHIEGFDDRIDQMRAGQIEATFAEFDFGRFLYLHDIAFRFVEATGVRGKDYDCAIKYADGREACADAKCRLEETEMRAETVRNSLNKARTNNLPSDAPGIVFVKVPQAWLEQQEVRLGIRDVVKSFLHNTERIVSVVVYATHMMAVAENTMILMRHRFEEYPNLKHRFDMSKSWTLFKDYKVPDEWGGMHPKWVRIFSQGFVMRDK